jgi:hypothetical protein
MALQTKNIKLSGATIFTKTKEEAPKIVNKKNVRELHKELIDKHKLLFIKEKVNNPKFLARVCFKDKQTDEYVIALYPSEMVGSKDIYIELCKKDTHESDEIEGLFKKDTLWKWFFNPEFATEYKKYPNPVTNEVRYLIPIADLINVTEHHNKKEVKVEPIKDVTYEVEKEEQFLDGPSSGEDVPYDAMTLRDYAAIHLKLPVSNKKWLNQIIKNNFNE